MTARTRSIAYWIVTLFFIVGMGGSAIADLVLAPPIVEGITHLGYPVYFITLLGVWKALGVVALAAPGFPRLKEWAYAGFFFHLSGAIVSHLAVGEGSIVAPASLLALAVASWALRPDSRVLGHLMPTRTRAREDAGALVALER